MNEYEYNECISYVNSLNPLFKRFLGKMDEGGLNDFFKFWQRELEPFSSEDFRRIVDERTRKGWGEWEVPHALEVIRQQLGDERASNERKAESALLIQQATDGPYEASPGFESGVTSPGVWDNARTTFLAIEKGRKAAKEQCQMLEKIYHAVYEELGIEVTKNGPSGMHAAKLAGKAEEVKAEVRRRWLEYLEAEHNITAGV